MVDVDINVGFNINTDAADRVYSPWNLQILHNHNPVFFINKWNTERQKAIIPQTVIYYNGSRTPSLWGFLDVILDPQPTKTA